MSDNPLQEDKNFNNISKVSMNFNKPNLKIKSLKIENDNSSSNMYIFRNAGKELLDSKRYFTSEDISQNSPLCHSIINLKHKGIKRKGHPLYDPYLIKVCKNALIREKNELPNFKDIIHQVNTEFGIEDEKFIENDFSNFHKNNYNFLSNNNISSFNNSSNVGLKDINNSAMSTNINEKR